ncbi:fused PTS fructose transporter subunit IIA/HPr protein [Arsenophonus sp. aPb]|uniref:fused PTS fructose transporter subunit IIA/HPr protein n=1 Tax=Arsenophonus sp. aPb TaxID=3041619 RepID=UPI0024688E35|nr:fused PTS fructose transporter subunit IIA/HPr protein [Arsenophonus sp. aPb]WGL98752.1 fused PTS fructose transporter subunit IIA/HPr protein [Arsenophonus sp. aPb]
MFDVSKKDIHLAQFADHKQHAIAQVAQALINAGYVTSDYLTGMQKRENQASTYLGNGIAIPHGTVETRHNVLQTGVQIFQFPQGVDWDNGQKAYIVIGIAAKSEEHLSLLRQLTHILSDENIAKEMATTKSIDSIYNILLAKESLDDFIFKASMITLDVDTNHIMTLQALNINHLQDANAINNDFIVDVITNPPLYLGQGIWLSDSKKGNLKTAMAIARPKQPLSYQDHQLCLLITLSCKDNRANNTLNHLANLLIDKKTAKLLQAPDAVGMFTLLTTNTNEEKGTLSAEFTLNNKHGLHARPSSQLVNTIKKFNSKVTITNLDGNGIPANGHNIMSVIGLVARQNDRIQFKISGPDAQATLHAIEQVINANMDEKIA